MFYKFIISIFVAFTLITFSANAQKNKKGIEYRYDVSKVASTNEVVWYGIDFSKAKLTDAAKINEGSDMKSKYFPGWIALLNSRYNDELLKDKLKKENYISDLNAVQSNVKLIDENNIVAFSNYSFPIDSVIKYVNEYKLPQTKGTGFVLIIENLNKPLRYTTGYFVFFDIEKRSIYYAVKMKGLPGSKYGFSQWWKEGLNELFDYYIRDYLKPVLKKK